MTHRARKSLPSQKNSAEREDDAILGEVVNPQLVNSRTIEKFADKDREHEDLERFLSTINNFTREQASIVREHAEKHPDAIEHRNTKQFRRQQYSYLLIISVILLAVLPISPLAVVVIFGMVAMVIISGILVNARERELDLKGFITIIKTIVGRKDQ